MMCNAKRVMMAVMAVILIYCSRMYTVILERDCIKEIQYRIEPIIKGASAELSVECSIALKELPDNNQDDEDTSLLLVTPFKEGPVDLMAGFKDMHILAGAASITIDKEQPFVRSLQGINSNVVRIQYKIIATVEDITHIDKNYLYYKPIITPNFFHTTGRGIFVYPVYLAQEKRGIQIPTTIEWHNIPRKWSLANSFGANTHKQTFLAQPEALAKGIYIGGNFTVTRFDCFGYPIYIAMQDTWTSLTPRKLADIIAPMIRSQRAFWNDFEYPHFIVTLLKIAPSGPWRNGDSATNGIKLFLPGDTQIDHRLIHLIGHELFHIWNGQTITFDDHAHQWFHQGLTDYYADQSALCAGILPYTDYINAYNKVLTEYYTSPAINMTEKEAQGLTWHNYAAQKLPYQQGYLVAHNWNAALKKASHNTVSLDDIMRELRIRTTEFHSKFSKQMLIDICKKYIPDIGDQIEQYITQGATIKPLPEVFGQLGKLVERDVEILDFGFDVDVSVESMIVTGVRPDGPAYKVGLRDGDIIKELLSRFPDSTRDPVRLAIEKADGVVKRVEYYPVAQKIIKIPHLDFIDA